MRKFCHLLAPLVLLTWTTATNAGSIRENAHQVPGHGTTGNYSGEGTQDPSLMRLITVVQQAARVLCISPCWAGDPTTISYYVPVSRPVRQVPEQFAPGGSENSQGGSGSSPGGQGGTPGGNGPEEFDPLVIATEILEEDLNDPKPVHKVTSEEEELPNPLGVPPGLGGPPVFSSLVSCEPQTQDEICAEGSAANGTVPLPSTLLLFGIGLLGLARLKHKHP